MSRTAGRRSALAVMALCLAAASWAGATTAADAQTAREEPASQTVVDLFGVDLVGQTPATTSSPAVIHLQVAAGVADADFRARVYSPVTTRAELTRWGPPVASWMIDDVREVGTDESGTFVSVPIRLPDGVMDEGPDAAGGGWPLPLSLELVDSDGSLLAALHTFLLPFSESAAGDAAPALTVAVVLDLRLPPSHLADGGAAVDEALFDRVLRLAEVLTERDGVPLSVAVSPETLDALALIGDDTSVAVLRVALRDRQLLTTTWTSLDLYGWTRTVRVDVVLDGLRRGAEALRWAGLEPSPVMHLEHPPTVRVTRAVTEPAIGVDAFVAMSEPAIQMDGFVADTIPIDRAPLPPVTSVAEPSGRSYLMAQADPLLSAMLHFPDPELGAQWVLAELSRMAAEGTTDAVVVSAIASAIASDPDFNFFEGIFLPSLEPSALALLLDGINDSPRLSPVTVDDVLAQQMPVGTVNFTLPDRPSDPRDFDLYLARRVQVEQRLEAYESFLGDDPSLAEPLRTLLAVSASRHLTTGERTEFLNAVDQQVTQGTTGVEFVGRGPITFTARNADLPVTLVNNRTAPVSVTLEVTSDSIAFTHQQHPVFTLEPGRNDLTVPVEAAASGRTSVRVAVTTPDQAGAITLTTGTFNARFTDAEGLGFLILILAAVVLGAWWLQTLRKRARDADSRSATVAAPGSVLGDTRTEARRAPPFIRRSHKDTT